MGADNYRRLSKGKRAAIQIHIALCAVCGKFHRQLIALQEGEFRLLGREEEGSVMTHEHLPGDAKSRLKDKIAAEIEP